MLEYAIKGDKKYYGWIAILLGLIGVSDSVFTCGSSNSVSASPGMSRDVSWGFYIAQLTFLVGVAAGGVMVVLPYYLHDYKAFGRITMLGEFLAIAALIMCMLSVVVDLGQPMRVLNVFCTPRPIDAVL
jgi:Ni/Fe-hydrogenase subunit HybB-like protein